MERQSEKRILRRQELQELRKLQIEEQRKMAALQHKLGSQTEQLTQKCERQIYVSPMFQSWAGPVLTFWSISGPGP